MRSDEEEGAVCGSSQSSWEVETRLQANVRANAKATADWLIRGEGWLHQDQFSSQTNHDFL